MSEPGSAPATCKRDQRFVREAGQTLVIFALLLPVLFGTLALLIDGGFLYGQRRAAQNAADAAALAGGLAVGASGNCDGSATGRANYLAQGNGAPNPTAWYTLVSSVTPTGGPTLPVCRVAIGSAITSRPFLSGVFGRSSLRAGAAAVAVLAGVDQYGNDPAIYLQAPLLPVAIELTSLQTHGFSTTVQPFGDASTGPTGFFWFLPAGTSCSDSAVDTAVTAATHFTVSAGATVNLCSTEDDTALQDLAARSPVVRTVILTSGNAGTTATVLGFAFVSVENTQWGLGVVPEILAYFVQASGPVSAPIGPGTTPNYGVYNVGLVQ